MKESIFVMSKLSRHIVLVCSESELVDMLKQFRASYEVFETEHFKRAILKAQKGLLDEIDCVLKEGLRHDLEWHKREILNYADEILSLAVTY